MKKKNKFGAISTPKFRSKLEATAWQALKKAKLTFGYENITFTLLDGFDFPSLEKVGKKMKRTKRVRPVTYTPDFIGNTWIIETKGVRTPAFNIKWKLFKLYILDNDLNYELFMPSNKKEIEEVISIIKTEM